MAAHKAFNTSSPSIAIMVLLVATVFFCLLLLSFAFVWFVVEKQVWFSFSLEAFSLKNVIFLHFET